MPQTMRRKREGSLERLQASLTMHTRAQDNTQREGFKKFHSDKIVNITRMIEQTEAAILRN